MYLLQNNKCLLKKSFQESFCICHSNTTVVVFNSTKQCAICGGGEVFDVESSFFNENGNTRGCIYSNEASCSKTSTGWTQYVKDNEFYGNNSFYQPAENFSARNQQAPQQSSPRPPAEPVDCSSLVCLW